MRTAFLVDGFNLYHSLKTASRDLGGTGTRWLDLAALCGSCLHLFGRDARIAGVFYFSALAEHLEALKPEITTRHLAYLEALHATGVTVELSQFKKKWLRCSHCSQEIVRHEEKETDVALAVKLLELCWRNLCDAVVLVTLDSDLAPAVRAARRNFPDKSIHCLFPYARGSFELRRLAHGAYRLKRDRYLRHQLPDTLQGLDGRVIRKPPMW